MKQSAGILLYKITKEPEVFLVHPGGPFWKNKELGAWSIPKGEYSAGEAPLEAAIREFKEETGIEVKGKFTELTPVKLKSGKLVRAWALEGDLTVADFKCESFIEIEWPPRSGKSLRIPEVDKGEWFTIYEAKKKVNSSQVALIDELTRIIPK